MCYTRNIIIIEGKSIGSICWRSQLVERLRGKKKKKRKEEGFCRKAWKKLARRFGVPVSSSSLDGHWTTAVGFEVEGWGGDGSKVRSSWLLSLCLRTFSRGQHLSIDPTSLHSSTLLSSCSSDIFLPLPPPRPSSSPKSLSPSQLSQCIYDAGVVYASIKY